jgi:hypothetical protein
MNWPTVEELSARAPLPTGYRYEHLTRTEVPDLIDALAESISRRAMSSSSMRRSRVRLG